MVQRSASMDMVKCFDLICLVTSWLVPKMLLSKSNYLEDLVYNPYGLHHVVIAVTFITTWHCILYFHKLYVSRRLSSMHDEVVDIVMATSLGSLVLLLFARILDTRAVDVDFLFLFWLSNNVLLISSRIVLRYALKQIRAKGIDLRNIVIAGINDRALLFAQKILSKPELGYRLIGFIDDPAERTPHFDNSEYRLVADLENFHEFLRRQVVDEVMICLPVKSHYEQAANIAAACEEHGIVVRFLSDIFNTKLAHSTIYKFEGHCIVTLYTGHMVGWSVFVKRIMDFAVSAALLLLLSPVFLLAALMIKVSSQGPVIFVQKRMGLNKRHFHVYKFRTMHCDAEQRQVELEHLNEMDGAVFKIRNDPRITRVGRFLRKTSIDELPQLVNVLKGEMSLVGPRPLPIRDYEGFDKDWHRRRFSVRPGITCLWQISGRNNISFESWMELDMHYIDNWSLRLDFIILVKTIPAVLKGVGAV